MRLNIAITMIVATVAANPSFLGGIKNKFKNEITRQIQQFMTTEIEVEAEILAGTNRGSIKSG